ncbi:MAG: M67 family metallopeptidase [Candidatus Dormibacteraeota bacterium]|nr:M67 family metallopeptidase [Candidatus Dormibacteraeota bacterium]
MVLPPALRARLRRLAEAAYPYEGCGLLLGTPGAVTEVRAGRNLRSPEDRARDRYVLDPRDILQAERDADAGGLQVLGFWHTHPDHPSGASRYDADHAWPGYCYVIVSVLQGVAVGEQGWVLESESPAEFREEPLRDQ